MWISRRKSSREIDNIDGLIRRSSSKRNFIHSSLKDVANLFADDNSFTETLDLPSPCSTAAAAARRLSIFHRVHLANKFARAFSAKLTLAPAKSQPESNNAAAAEELTKSLPESNNATAAEKLAKSPPESNNAAAERFARAFSAKQTLAPAISPPESKNAAAVEELTKSPPESNNVTAAAEKLTKSLPESNNADVAEKLTKSLTESNNVTAAEKLTKSLPESNNIATAEKLTKSNRLISIPGAETRVVVYTTSLRVVRPTFEACRTVQSILRGFRISIDERDLSMDSKFLDELHNIMAAEYGGDAPEKPKLTLPRVFIGGRYVGGAEEVKQLHETGELKKIVDGLPAVSSAVCDGCGDIRFILCDECRGSHKCYTEKGGFRSCTLCNENGLVRCPSCFGRY